MDKKSEIWQNLQRFANEHKIILQDKGEIGFGRPCVGFMRGDNYISFNPVNDSTFDWIWPQDDRLYPPSGVNKYHKGYYLAVLVCDDDDSDDGDYDAGLTQLNDWIKHLESQGEVHIEKFSTGATGLQAAVSGFFDYAIRINDE